MNSISVSPHPATSPRSSLRIPCGLLLLLWLTAPLALAQAGDEKAGVVAEIWPLDKALDKPASPATPPTIAAAEAAASAAAPREFEKWRSQAPPAGGTMMTLERLAIPARESVSMVRVRGVLIPPKTCDYAFRILGPDTPDTPKIARPDEAELWLGDDNGAWRLVQRTGNPNPRSGRSALKQGVPTRFEFWTTGSREISVQWLSEDRNPQTNGPVVNLPREVIPASCMRPRAAEPDDRQGDGLRDEWKRKWRLDPDSGEGPAGPWGDPDGDCLLNWQEQLAGSNPLAADAEGCAGLVRWETWRGIPGQYVFDLTRSAAFPQGQRELRYRDRLEVPVANGDNYGSRLRGLIKAPTDGEYTFMLIADDSAELWLGETDSWKTKRLIVRANQKGASQLTWTRSAAAEGRQPLFPEQSARVVLEKGQQYYVEVLHKQAFSQDHCAVAWVRPGVVDPELVGAEALVAWKPDKEDVTDDGLPDEWQQSVGLLAEAVEPTLRGATADPDRDGLSNWDEWKAGGDPLKKNVADPDHALSCESWTGCPGNQVRDLVFDKRYPAKPDLSTRVDNMDFSDEGTSYGVRLRGYLTAPDDGPYLFSISGNNACTLYLADSEDKFTKRAIAWITSGTQWRSFVWQPCQRSAPIDLKKGQRYYIEVLYKRGEFREADVNPKDHSSVAWSRPGRDQSVIGAEFFSPYGKDPRDNDDDDLPNNFEEAHGLDPKDPAGVNGAWGDPDGDMLGNFLEFQAGLDPQVADVHGTPGLALWEYWQDIHGKLAGLKSSPSFPLHATRREWLTSLEAPRGMGVFYGSRLRALLVAPVTGDYTFAIAGHNGCELSLSPSESKYDRRLIASVENASKFREWQRHPTQMSGTIRLQAGERYFIEALHVQDVTANYDHLSVAWKIPGTTGFEVIDGGALIAFASDPTDTDDDDLPDDWQKANGIALGSGSGDKDLDGDGLTNREEYRFGTRADLADTDGDGSNDHDELQLYHSNPLVKDTPAPVKFADISLASYQAPPGNWLQTQDGTLRSMTRRGALVFEITLEKPGVYMVELQAAARSASNYVPPIPIIMAVDGAEFGWAEVVPGGSTLHFLTSLLSAGTHTLTIDNRNVRSGLSLEIIALTLYQHQGADLDENGNPDWIDGLLRRENHFAATGGESAISPTCIEGSARYSEDVGISGEAGEIETQPGLAGRWFANVPLDPSNETKITASFENDTIHEELGIKWTSTNLFEAPAILRVRLGDSLKLIAVPPGSAEESANGFELTVDDTPVNRDETSGHWIVTFDKPGRIRLLARPAETNQGFAPVEVTVEVVAADFGEPFSLASDSQRMWNLPGIPKGVHVETDPPLSLTETTGDGGEVRCFEVGYPAEKSGVHQVLARLAEGGPVVAATRVNAFFFANPTMTGNHHVVQVLPDGTRVVEVRYVIDGPIPANLSVWIHLYVTDALFENGDTWYELTAADFDEFGEARLRILKAPGTGTPFVCQWIMPFGEGPEAGADNP